MVAKILARGMGSATCALAGRIAGRRGRRLGPLRRVRAPFVSLLALSLVPVVAPPTARAQGAVEMDDILDQPADWYAGGEARRIADNILLFQRSYGGWPRNQDMTAPLSGDAA